MVNVKICSGSQCMLNGASMMYDVLEDLASDLKEQGYEQEVTLEFTKCLQYCKDDKNLAPVVIVDEEVITKASTQVVMEKIMGKVVG